jgi:hypothetical protein
MNALKLRLTLATGALLAFAAAASVPEGWYALRLLDAADDPVRLSDVALERSFTRNSAVHEIETALAAGDAELAASFVELATERAVPIDASLRERVAAANSAGASAVRTAGRFMHGLVTGAPEDAAGLAGTLTGDLFVFGDIRDVAREVGHSARGEEVDEVILGLACVGLAVTAGAYASLGAAAPARVGLSLVKAASRSGRMSAAMLQSLSRPLRESIDVAALRGFGKASLVHPVAAVRSVRQVVKLEKARDLLRLAGDLGSIQTKAGTRAALDGLRIADSPKEMTRLARLAEAKGGKTRAVMKVLGRGAIVLTVGAFQLAGWILWALLNVIALVVAFKRTAERATLSVIQASKARRIRRLALMAGPG